MGDFNAVAIFSSTHAAARRGIGMRCARDRQMASPRRRWANTRRRPNSTRTGQFVSLTGQNQPKLAWSSSPLKNGFFDELKEEDFSAFANFLGKERICDRWLPLNRYGAARTRPGQFLNSDRKHGYRARPFVSTFDRSRNGGRNNHSKA